MKHLLSMLAIVTASVFAENEVRLVETFKGVDHNRPTDLVIPPDGSNRLFLIQQRGQIDILPEDRNAGPGQRFLDLSDRKMAANLFEEGLLGLAFHPDYKTNRKFYIYYSQQDPKRSVISEMQASADDPNQADPSTERILLQIPQPYWNHNSGNMLFGPDGYLYIAVGDGGKGDDVTRLAQNLFAMNGKILRIDVNTKTGARAYGIPADNPFIEEKEGVLYEIYSYGMRNPWGLCFHPESGQLWCADVGQDLFEEINIIEAGGNYGWSYREGKGAFYKRSDAPPEGVVFKEPLHVYGRSDGLSITGGFFYQGAKFPSLKGSYIYGDWRLGTMWALKYDQAAGKVIENRVIYKIGEGMKDFRPSAFCPDAQGEILALSWEGKVYEVAPTE
ncbi:MAG: glucose/arabinose dehydrogenase [Candidatus Omnitrophota bacterium]|jgi:glucose/arabinose dehydrogenase